MSASSFGLAGTPHMPFSHPFAYSTGLATMCKMEVKTVEAITGNAI